MLLIVTSLSDFTADYVICGLRDEGVPYFRLNTEDLGSAAYEFRAEADGCKRRLTVDNRALDIDEVQAVWFRRQPMPLPRRDIPAAEQAFARGELLHLVEGLMPLPGVRWIDYPTNVRRAERKLQQLAVANEIGLRIPHTLVTTDVVALRTFVDSQPNGAVCKPIFRGLHLIDDGAEAAYTRIIDRHDLPGGDGPVFPTLLQALVPKGADIRLTIIGSTVYPVRITSASGEVDWRVPGAEPQYEIASLPEALIERCQLLLTRFGLSVGALDFAESPTGELYFLEINPVGEWAWLDRALHLGMRERLIRHLLRPAI